MRRFRFSIRGLMLVTVVAAFDATVMAGWRKHSLFDGDDGILIGVLLGCLNCCIFTYVWIVRKLARTPQEGQSPWIMSLGCLLAAMLVIAVPILIVLSLS